MLKIIKHRCIRQVEKIIKYLYGRNSETLYSLPIAPPPHSQTINKQTNGKQAVRSKRQHQHRPGYTPGGLTLADDLWLGSSRGFRAPTPRVGSCVWKTDIRPPVGDINLNAA